MACTEVVTLEATPRRIPMEEACRFSEETPKENPRHTRKTAKRVGRDEWVRRRYQEKKTVKGRTSPRAICCG